MERVKVMQEVLKDGSVLCALVNKIKPGSVKKVNASKMPFKMRENIVKYLDACKALGMSETDLFVAQDLFEGDNMLAVIDQITSLGSIAQSIPEYTGPTIGPKKATANVREFSEEVLKQSITPQINAGGIKIEKEKGTDAIVRYGKVGQEMGKSAGGYSQLHEGSVKVEKEKGTDAIVRYGKVGQEMGVSHGGTSQLNEGALKIEKEKGTDSIVRYGKVGQEMGVSHGGTSQQNDGALAVEKQKNLDSLTRNLN